MFNFSGSEIVFLLLLALIVLGPEKLPEAIRKFGQAYGEFKKVTTGFQTELKQALDEPMREMRETAEMFKQAASLDVMNPLEEAASALRSVTDPAPAAIQAPARLDGDAPGAADAASGAAPPRASAAAAAAANAARRPFDSAMPAQVQNMHSLDEVRAAKDADATSSDAPAPAGSAEVSTRPPGPAFHSAMPRAKPPAAAPAEMPAGSPVTPVADSPAGDTPADPAAASLPVAADAGDGSADGGRGPGTV